MSIQDGRVARRTSNTDAVVDAMLDLIAEGNLRPGAAEIAERSGVSARSLFRYFDDLDSLARAAVERQTARKDHLFQPLDDDGTLEARVERLVDHRLALWREVGPTVRAVWPRAPFQPAFADGLAHRRAQLAAQVAALLPEATADQRVAVDLLTGFEALDRLAGERRARTILLAAVLAVVGARPGT